MQSRRKLRKSLRLCLKGISKNGVDHYVVFNQILYGRLPKFLYFDEYYQMKGQDNLDALKQRVANETLEESDHPLLGLIELAGLNLDQLTNPERTEALLAKLDAAGNSLTQRVLKLLVPKPASSDDV